MQRHPDLTPAFALEQSPCRITYGPEPPSLPLHQKDMAAAAQEHCMSLLHASTRQDLDHEQQNISWSHLFPEQDVLLDGQYNTQRFCRPSAILLHGELNCQKVCGSGH